MSSKLLVVMIKMDSQWNKVSSQTVELDYYSQQAHHVIDHEELDKEEENQFADVLLVLTSEHYH
jgi:hypothetical protein